MRSLFSKSLVVASVLGGHRIIPLGWAAMSIGFAGAVASAQTPSGEQDVNPAVYDPARHEQPNPINAHFPVLLPGVTACDHEILPFPFVTDPSINYERFFRSGAGLFTSKENPSVCVHRYVVGSTGDSPDNNFTGRHMNYDKLYGPDVPTLPALGADLVSGSSPLVPAGPDGAYDPMFSIAERETAAGSLDLITGRPLMQSVDLELQFGGATFRHVRTYSEPTSFVDDSVSDGVDLISVREFTPNTRLWDWHGIGWMVGHNPLFLFDSARGGQTELIDGNDFASRRCYFIPDAHHAIPFDMRIGGDGMPIYEAPARFGAHLSYDKSTAAWDADMYDAGGVGVDPVGGWSTLPPIVEVWMHHGAVKYTIAILPEDILEYDSDTGALDHDPSDRRNGESHRGYGVPYIGLTLQIEDRYGNKIVNSFCGFHQYTCSLHQGTGTGLDPDDTSKTGFYKPSTEVGVWPDTRPDASQYPPTTANRVCCQSCHRKGQLQRTYLIAAGQTEPAWTIVYSHRSFLREKPTEQANDLDLRYPYNNQVAINAMRAYRGNVLSTEPCMTVDFRAFHPESEPGQEYFLGQLDLAGLGLPVGTGSTGWNAGLYSPTSGSYNGMAKLEAIIDRLNASWSVTHPAFSGSGELADDWEHEVRYLYTDASDVFMANPEVFPGAYRKLQLDRHVRMLPVQPRLIGVMAESRLNHADGSIGKGVPRGSAYRYALDSSTSYLAERHDSAVLCAAFEPGSVANIYNSYQQTTGEYQYIQDLVIALAVDDLDARVPMSTTALMTAGGTGGFNPRDLTMREAATRYFGYWGHDSDDASTPLGHDELVFVVPGVRRVTDASRSYGDLDIHMQRFASNAKVDDMMTSDFMDEMIEQIGLGPSSDPVDDLVFLFGGPVVVADGLLGRQRAHKVYRFFEFPQTDHAGDPLPIYLPRGRHEAGWLCRAEAVGGGGIDGNKIFQVDRSLLMFPHRLMDIGAFQGDESTGYFTSAPRLGQAANLNRAVWYAIIDEYSDLNAALVTPDTLHESGYGMLPKLDATVTNPALAALKPNTRRIVAMNAMGYVVWERTYEVDADGIRLTGGEGHRQASVYDDQGRVLMTKSYGWSAAELDGTLDDDDHGLVTVYDYDYGQDAGEPILPNTTHPRRIGVQWGDNGDEIDQPNVEWIVEYSRDEERPDVILAEVRFDGIEKGTAAVLPAIGGIAIADVSSATWKNERNILFHDVKFSTAASGSPAFSKAIEKKLSASAWDQVAPGSSPKKLAVVAEAFDLEGRHIAIGRGLVLDPENPGNDGSDIFHVDWFHYDDEGRIHIEIQDARHGVEYDHGLVLGVSATPDITTLGWKVNAGPYPTQGQYVTSHRYGDFALEETLYPNGETRELAYKRVFDDLQVVTMIGPHVSGSGGGFDPNHTSSTFMSGRMETAPGRGGSGVIGMKSSREGAEETGASRPSRPSPFGGGHVSVAAGAPFGENIGYSRTQVLVTPDGQVVRPEQAGLMDVVVEREGSYDPSGRPRSEKFTNSDGESLEFKSAFNHFGTSDRSETPFGTVTRNVYDELGRLIRVYRGTDDWAVHFGAPPDGFTAGDMALAATFTYGIGLHDAMQLSEERSYRAQPSSVYASDLDESAGQLTRIIYDWQMRPVIRVQCTDGASPAPLRVTVTHLDQMGRERFVAVYDDSILVSQRDPTNSGFEAGAFADLPTGGAFLYGGAMPTATQFAGGGKLISLIETTYNQRGLVASVREYDLVGWDTTPDASAYQASFYYYNHNGQPVHIEQPGGGLTVVSYDAFGREVRRSVRAEGIEVSRVETSYSPDGMAEEIFSYDRLDDAAGTDLDHTNAVVNGMYHWYRGGDLICTADLGTWRAGNAPYGAGTTAWPAYDSEDPPVVYENDAFTISPPVAFAPVGSGITARISAYVYDERGNRSLIRHPDGTVTRHVYDDWGNIALTQEGITLDSSGALDTVGRATSYRYEKGKLVKVAALLPPLAAATDPTVGFAASFQTAAPPPPVVSYQVTEFEYGAEVVVWNSSTNEFVAVSANNDWVGAVKFPDANGDPSSTADLEFQYYPDGLLASRTDARGVVFEHLYDDLGRRIWTHVLYPDDTGIFDGGSVKPADRVELVGYEYDDASGVLTRATAWSEYTPGVTPADADIVARSEFEYDANQRLVSESQQRGDVVTTSSPKIEYTWDVQHHDQSNQARLTSMQYPQHLDAGVASGRLTLDFIYNTSQSIDDVLGRVHEIEAGVNAATTRLASFAYTGSGMRVRRSVSDNGGVERAIEGFFADDGSVTDGYEHLDQFGRIRDLHWRDSSGVAQYRAEYLYDAMGNRIAASVTRRNSSQAAVPDTWSWDYGFDALQRLIQADADEDDGMSGRTSLATHAWTMDPLGNWAGDGTLPGLHVTDGAAGLRDDDIVHEVGRFNRIESKSVDGGTPTDFVYDRMGNLVSDGVYWYRYDAWNRLIQVVEDPGTFTFDANGKKDGSGPVFADVVAVFAYDSLGRLVGRQAPYPGTTDEWRTETYFYDGARRIAEQWRDPIIGNNGGGNNGNQQNQQTQYVTWTEREYVYTPGYIDEFVAEYDAAGNHWPVLQDANFNAVALAHRDGRVARQRVLSPYGRVIQEDSTGFVTGSPATRIGHQGLFAERLDADTRQNPQAANGAVVWHNRQRTLHAEYGRFLQRDPQATGVTVPQTLWWHSGERPIESASSGRVQPSTIGMLLSNQYQYVMSQPGRLVDPIGGYPIAPGFYGPGVNGGLIYVGPNDHLSNLTREVVANEREARVRSGRSSGRSGALAAIEIGGRLTGATYAAALYDGEVTEAYGRTVAGIAKDAAWAGLGEGVGRTVGGRAAMIVPVLQILDDPSLWNIGKVAASTAAASIPFAAPVVGIASFYSGVLEYMAESVYDW